MPATRERPAVPSTTEVLEAVRVRPFAVAYRVPGSASGAEDVLQDAYGRWAAAAGVREPEAFAVRVVTRLCLTESACPADRGAATRVLDGGCSARSGRAPPGGTGVSRL